MTYKHAQNADKQNKHKRCKREAESLHDVAEPKRLGHTPDA
jgi:hypothetical protein